MPYRTPLGYPFDPGAVGVKFFLLDMDYFVYLQCSHNPSKTSNHLSTSKNDTLPDYPFLYKYGWDSGDTLDGELPEVFLIIEPECQAVENITVTADPNGCLHAVWDSLPWQGREVTACTLGGGRAVLDVSALPRGVYLLRFASDKGAASRRVVLL